MNVKINHVFAQLAHAIKEHACVSFAEIFRVNIKKLKHQIKPQKKNFDFTQAFDRCRNVSQKSQKVFERCCNN